MTKTSISQPPAAAANGDPAYEALRISETCYRRLFETTQDGILLLNANTAQIEYVNPFLINLLEYSHDEFLGKSLWDIGGLSDSPECKTMFAELLNNGFAHCSDLPLISRTGRVNHVEFISNSYDVDGIKILHCNIRDITDRVLAEAESQRHAQLYAALSACNKAIVHCNSEKALYLQVCRAAVEFGGMTMAWIGLIDPETRKVQPVACFGDNTDYIDDIDIFVEGPLAKGPTAIALRENRPYWCQDFLHDPATTHWHQRAALAGVAGSASLPLYREGRAIGAFGLYTAEINAFDEATQKLLREMADDISFALDNFTRKSMHERANEEIAFKNTIIQTQQETSLDAILLVDENGHIISYNQQFIKLWQISSALVNAGLEEPVLQSVLDMVEKPEAFVDRIRYLYENRDENSREEILLKDGRIIDRYSAPVIGANGKYYGRVWYFRDITEKKRIENELLIAATAFEVQEGIIIADAQKTILRVNKAFTRLTGYSAEEAVGHSPALIKSGRHNKEFYQQMWASLNQDHYWQGELWDRHKNGDVRPYWVTITAITNADGEITHYVSAHSDLSQQKKNEAKIHALAFYDPLTNLPNRRLLLDRLQHAITANQRHHNHGAVLFIDLDNFKNLNDTRGHNIGDQLLTEVASRLQGCVRAEDTVARLGGDEFVIVLEKLDAEISQAVAQTEAICNAILATIRQPYSLLNFTYHGSASIGIVLFRGESSSVSELLRRADAAMYQAKSAGRNTRCFYDPIMQAKLESRTNLENDLRHALMENEFCLHYQRQVDQNGHVLGAEALIRWQHPQRGLIPPQEFIPLAEQSGLITSIGWWVLENACAQLKAWESDPITQELHLAINVSALQFHQPEFVEQVRKAIQIYGLDPSRLKLELTESLVLDDIQDSIATMRTLKEAGVRFAMDDFGTGYSSLSYLTQLPLDQLKIDQSFVHNIDMHISDAIIVQTIIGMAHSLGIEVLAEGVETDAQRTFLERNGCLHYQGYLFGKPMPINEFEAKLKEL